MNYTRSYIDSRKWLKHKKAKMYPKNSNDYMCFRYAVTARINHEKIEKKQTNKPRKELQRLDL